MFIRCINRPFQDLESNTWRNVGDEWEASEERLAAINAAGYGAMAEAVEEAAEAVDLTKMTRSKLLEEAEARGVEIPAKATKAEIIGMLEG